MKFIKKHSFVSTILAIILLVTFYYAFVVIKAYIETPEIISRVLTSDRMVLKLEDFSDENLNILLSVEDPSFYSHNGIDMKTPGAGMTTITQGIVKRYYFDNFKPGVIAKIRQSLIALILNRRVDKRTQLNLFVNTVYMGTVEGQDVIGFSDAAKVYYSKNFSDLSRDEYISLVAMIIGPNDFNLKRHPDKNADRVRRIKKLLSGDCKPAGNSDVYYENCK